VRLLLKQAEWPRRGFSLRRYLTGLDWMLLLAALGLTGMGLAMIYSATHADPGLSSPYYYVRSQAQGLVLGLVLLFAISALDYTRALQWQRVIYAGMTLLLVLTLVIGATRMGARRWIELPFFDLQSSELSKVLLIVSLGAFLYGGIELRPRFRFILMAVAYTLVPTLLVYVQPDLGTALVFAVILLALLLVWGIRWTHLAALLGMATLGVVAVVRVLPTTLGIQLLKPYQLERLSVFLNPEHDPTGPGYQLTQSKIAVASGMFAGKGYMQGTQTHLNFLPAHHTDFIFSIVGEELGFVGATVLLGLYLVFVWRGFRIASMANYLYGTMVVAGVLAVMLFQMFLNIGMTIGIMPVAGVPLPFVSFGSSSLVVFLMAVGLMESVHLHSRN